MSEKKIKLAKENLERLIAFELMQFTKATGKVIEGIYVNPIDYDHNPEVYYEIDLELPR